MNFLNSPEMLVSATTCEVLPQFGLAFLVDDLDRTWTVTRGTDGPGLETLHEGQRVTLTVAQRQTFALAVRYAPTH